MALRLQGKVAVITGGNSGIGLATAKLFQAEGAKIIITGRRKEAVDTAVNEIGGACTGILSDTGNVNDITDLYQQIHKTVGAIDVLFLNAGIAIFGPFDTIDEAAFDAMVNVNFKGLFFNIQKAAPLLNDGASIIINSSIADQKGFPIFVNLFFENVFVVFFVLRQDIRNIKPFCLFQSIVPEFVEQFFIFKKVNCILSHFVDIAQRA